MPPRRHLESSDILEQALSLVAENGLDALTLRPLAQRLDVSVSSLTHRFGSKEALLAQLIAEARASEAETLSQWRARLSGADVFSPDALAESIDAILSELATAHARRSLFYCELVQISGPQPALWPLIAPWIEDRQTFWNALAARVHPQPAYALGVMLHAYVTDELAHALALERFADYGRLRRLGLKRLCGGLRGVDDARADQMSGDEVLAAHCIAVLGALPGDIAVDHDAPPPKGVAAQLVGHISDLIVGEGAGAVTHRAVAARAGVASSTLAYHFRTQEDLIRAGLEDIIRRMTGDVKTLVSGGDVRMTNPYSAVEIARATFAIALWATRRPAMLACAADMRRLRGINLHKVLTRRLSGLDPLAAQAMSATGMGNLMLMGHAGRDAATKANMETINALTAAFGAKAS